MIHKYEIIITVVEVNLFISTPSDGNIIILLDFHCIVWYRDAKNIEVC